MIPLYVDDSEGIEWLKYTIQVFQETTILNLEFEIQKFPCDHISPGITYSQKIPAKQKPEEFYIPRVETWKRSSLSRQRFDQIFPDDERLGKEEIPIYLNSFHPDFQKAAREKPFQFLAFDLFHNAFIRLSCWEETKNPNPAESYLKPTVNYLFAVLENYLLGILGQKIKPFLSNRKPEIILTHDIDAIVKTPINRVRYSALLFGNALQSLFNFRWQFSCRQLSRGLKFLFSAGNYFQLEQIHQLESRFQKKSLFFVYSRSSYRGIWDRIISFIFDPTYCISENNLLIQKLMDLAQNGWSIGLHSGFRSYQDPQRLMEEKTLLEKLSQSKVAVIRQHWLRLAINDSFAAYEKSGFETDMSLGFNNIPGFRAGIANEFKPYDYKQKTALNINEVPLILMDSQLFNHPDWGTEERKNIIDLLLNEVIKFGGKVSINWHQRVFSPDYGWGKEYEYLLGRICAKS